MGLNLLIHKQINKSNRATLMKANIATLAVFIFLVLAFFAGLGFFSETAFYSFSSCSLILSITASYLFVVELMVEAGVKPQ